MIKKLQQKLKSKKGFTLIELLIVIAVLGIIAAIAIPRFSGVLGSVKDKADVRAAELFAKEVYAELVVGNITGADTLADAASVTIAATDKKGFKGDIPTSQVDAAKVITAKITKTGTTYKIEVFRADTTGALATMENLTGPIN